MHWLSLVLGFVIAWVILAFIGPAPRTVSYYTQAPVVATSLSEQDAIMEAVGLSPSFMANEQSVADIELDQGLPSMAPITNPEPGQSVADLAPQPQEVPGDQDIPASPQAFSPMTAMAPAPQ
jgi:hypothetical protein